jgi:hypothetical protein
MTDGLRPEDVTVFQRQRFEAFADYLMPGGSTLPSPSDVQVGAGELDRLIAARPELAGAVLETIDGDTDPGDEIERLRRTEPERFRTFALTLAGTYLMNLQVRRSLGFPGIAPQKNPPAPGEAEFYLDGGLLNPVVARGEIFRKL